MIIKKQSFQYKNKVLIEKAIVKPPFKHERMFHDEGCFLYIKNSDIRLHSSQEKIEVGSTEAVLFNVILIFWKF